MAARSAKSRPENSPPLLKLMKSLRSGRPIRNRKFTWLSTKDRAGKEAIIMLDVAFVALGLAALALMGVYALALIQL